jgi:hypothetical protein
MRRDWMPALALLVALLGPTPGAWAAEGVVEINEDSMQAGGGFPVTLSGPGSYMLTSNLVVTDANQSALVLSGNEITLDLNGFALIGPNTCTGLGSALVCDTAGTGKGIDGGSRDFVTVKNGQVRGFASTGIELDDYARLENVTVRGNGGGGAILGTAALVLRAVVEANNLNGLQSDHYAAYLDSTARANQSNGLSGNQGSIFRGNASYDNGIDGIQGLFGTNVLHDNTAYLNENYGMRSSAGGILTRNVVTSNGNLGFLLNSNAGYGHNVIYKSGTGVGTVSGGLNLGGNLCSDTGTVVPCP